MKCSGKQQQYPTEIDRLNKETKDKQFEEESQKIQEILGKQQQGAQAIPFWNTNLWALLTFLAVEKRLELL